MVDLRALKRPGRKAGRKGKPGSGAEWASTGACKIGGLQAYLCPQGAQCQVALRLEGMHQLRSSFSFPARCSCLLPQSSLPRGSLLARQHQLLQFAALSLHLLSNCAKYAPPDIHLQHDVNAWLASGNPYQEHPDKDLHIRHIAEAHTLLQTSSTDWLAEKSCLAQVLGVLVGLALCIFCARQLCAHSRSTGGVPGSCQLLGQLPGSLPLLCHLHMRGRNSLRHQSYPR